jgi:hypothetical protein
MRVESVIFNGIEFRRYPDSKRTSDRNYFRPHAGHIRAGTKALHVEIWKSIHGPVPPGHHVHHIDENPGNNDPSNLECLPGHDHLSLHTKGKHRDPAHMARIIEMAKTWHRSEEGRAWHRKQARKTISRLMEARATYICRGCGKEFQGCILGRHFYCNVNCKQRASYQKNLGAESRICAVCGKPFMAHKHSVTKTCSRSCGTRLRWTKSLYDQN